MAKQVKKKASKRPARKATKKPGPAAVVELAETPVEIVPTTPEGVLEKFTTDRTADIQAFVKKYGKLKTKGIDDDAGLAKVTTAHDAVYAFRKALEEERVNLKAPALAYGRGVDRAAKAVMEITMPLEKLLLEQKKLVTDLREERDQAAAKAAQAINDERLELLDGMGTDYNPQIVAELDEETWVDYLEIQIEIYDKKQAQKAEDKAKIEAANQAADNRRLTASAELEKGQAKLAEERKKFAEEAQADRDKMVAEAEARDVKDAALREELEELRTANETIQEKLARDGEALAKLRFYIGSQALISAELIDTLVTLLAHGEAPVGWPQ